MAGPSTIKAAALQQRLTAHAARWPQITEKRYEDNVLPTGQPFGSPEDALDCAAGLYLGDPAN